ncbi:MAG: OmpH family outer membrane protein [Prevotellaceae bacterium]|nr:OmpH family outer membrane protein [Prevotellaceae bacterium]
MKTMQAVRNGLFICAVAAATCACNNKNDEKVAPITTPVNQAGELKLAYVLLDTLQNQYQFFKDIDEEMQKKSSAAEAQIKQAEQQVVALQNQMQKKMQSNSYTSEEQYNADQRRLQQLYENGQQLQARLGQQLQEEIAEKQKAVNDTVQAFMTKYAAEKGYDFIFSKTSTIDHLLYANPAYDVTEEVVAALNKRYKGKAEAADKNDKAAKADEPAKADEKADKKK